MYCFFTESFYPIKLRKGNGKISASGGNGLAGGGGGRVSVNVFSRHGYPKILVHGEIGVVSFVLLSFVHFSVGQNNNYLKLN